MRPSLSQVRDVSSMARIAVTSARAALPILLQSRWLWCLAAVLIAVIRTLLSGGDGLVASLGDTDDATRLVQVRELIAGAPWFDTTLSRMGAPALLVSHWSRLVDLPIAILMTLFGLVLQPATAELATRFVWPLVVLLVLMRLMVREAEARGGPMAGVLLLILAVQAMTAMFQFIPGRIDHHNMMILGTVSGLVVLLRVRAAPGQGVLAGALIGLGLAVGYEPLALTLAAVLAMALLAVFDRAWLPGVRIAAVSMAASLTLAFVATVPPSRWLAAHCDVLSLNMVVLFACGAAGLAAVERYGARWSVPGCLAVLAGCGGIGALLFAGLNPKCLGGPFGEIDPAVRAIWLDHVFEFNSIVQMLQADPITSSAVIGFFAVSIFAAAHDYRRLPTPERLCLLGLLLISIPLAFWLIKLSAYATWFAALAIALAVARLAPNGLAVSRPIQQLAAVSLVNQGTLKVIVLGAWLAFGVAVPPAAPASDLERDACLTSKAIAPLAAVAPGLVLSEIDVGPFIMALTRHRVVAGPYHRLDKAILDTDRIYFGPAEAAAVRLRELGVAYVVFCAGSTRALGRTVRPESLLAMFKQGTAPVWLQPVALHGETVLKAWRVVP